MSEKYQPTSEEAGKAEAMMVPKQREMSRAREWQQERLQRLEAEGKKAELESDSVKPSAEERTRWTKGDIPPYWVFSLKGTINGKAVELRAAPGHLGFSERPADDFTGIAAGHKLTGEEARALFDKYYGAAVNLLDQRSGSEKSADQVDAEARAFAEEQGRLKRESSVADLL
jgi:hypothetical protein